MLYRYIVKIDLLQFSKMYEQNYIKTVAQHL